MLKICKVGNMTCAYGGLLVFVGFLLTTGLKATAKSKKTNHVQFFVYIFFC